MEDYIKISKEFGFAYIIQIITLITGFLIFPLLTRYLSIEEYGFYSLIIVSLNLITSILNMGLIQFIERDLTGKPLEYKNQKFSVIHSFYIRNILFLFILFLLFRIINNNINIINTSLLFYFFIILVLFYYSPIFITYIKSNLQINKSKFLSYLISDFWYLWIIIFVLIIGDININQIFIIKALVLIISTLIILFTIKKIKPLIKLNLDKKYLTKALAYGFPFVPIMVSQWIITASDRYIIKIFSNNTELGLYTYIYTLVAFIPTIAKHITSTLTTYMIEAKNKKQKERVNFLFNAGLKYSLMITIPAILGLLVLGNEIITMLSGPKYLPALYILPILSIYPLFRIININFQNILLLKENTKIMGKIYIIGTTINIILNFLLIPKYSILGASIATTVTYAIITLLFLKATKGQYKLNFNFLKIPQILISSAIMYITLSFLSPTEIIGKIIAILSGIIIYFLMIFLTKGYVKEEKELIKSILKIKKRKP